MADESSDSSDSFEITVRGSRRVEPYGSVTMSDKNLHSSSGSFVITYNGCDNFSFNYSNKSTRRPRMSFHRQVSPYAKKSPRRERSRTQDARTRNIKSPSVFSRLSMPGGSGLSSPGCSDAWITDSIAENPVITKKSEEKWLTERSKGAFLGSYQLLGDSLFVRFADQILKSPAVIGEKGKFCNGHCVSGQTITDLDQRISRDFSTTDVIVLIGTNDFLRRSRFNVMVKNMRSLMNFLSYCAENVVLLTLPPIPRLENIPGYWEEWENYNKWLKTWDNGKAVKVIDVAPLFMLSSRTPDMAAFESHMGYGDNKRVDHIHLNKLGLLRLYREIKKQLNIE